MGDFQAGRINRRNRGFHEPPFSRFAILPPHLEIRCNRRLWWWLRRTRDCRLKKNIPKCQLNLHSWHRCSKDIHIWLGSWESMWCDVCCKWDCVECHLVWGSQRCWFTSISYSEFIRLAVGPQKRRWDWSTGQDSENLFGLPQSFHTSRVWLCNKSLVTQLSNQTVNCFLLWATLFWWSNCCRLRETPIPTVDGWNPKQPPGMVLKPCKYWDKLPTSTGAGFLNHQQY